MDAMNAHPDRVIVGPPTGDGRVAFVRRASVPATPVSTAAADVLISVYGQRRGEPRVERLVEAAVRGCDLWTGEVDARLEALARWAGWVVTRVERRELATWELVASST
jgi:hypothetical protein